MEKNKLKFLIIGLGSMGKRRIRNLICNGQKLIIGYDIQAKRMKEAKEKYGIETANIKKAAKNDYDVMIISTPPDQHGDYIRMALRDKKHFFVEHPTSLDGYPEVLADKNIKIAKAPSCTLLYYSPIKMMKKILEQGEIGRVLAFQYHMGQYLPDWHPWEDYRQVYFSKKETGACREMLPFELIWLNWLLGSKVKNISGAISKVSDLKMKADDIINANVQYGNGIMGNIIIDVIARKPCRTLRVLGSEGVMDWERFDFQIKVFNAKTKKTRIIDIPKGHPETGYVNEEEMYNEEIGDFLKAIEGKKKFPHNFEDSRQVLNTLYALEEFSAKGKVMIVKK
ncbi:MAG: Gfo/Idh/MocA family oxidoreductase [Patescibacteria group bacterium]|jgi:predicted dehydrogenase